ncbi:OmpA family protein [Parapedobacter koreensis]|uniref:Chemotaxis protein MotB n=1 Tax=Parapedobacter koreensis TaxID=332977 RepID=A0A1H7L415_9SPHI|nr:OmpA family protein [Parapedobacter koreensis]SEK93574.1 chemotaxis protein MotB [Parapedobacter koreensis]
MKRLSIYAGMAFLAMALLLPGCVSNKRYNTLQENYDAILLKEREVAARYQDVQKQLSSANTRVTSLEDQIASERANVKSLQEALNQCLTSSNQGNVNISKLVDEINASNRYIQHLVNTKNKSDSLNMVLTNRLTRSLSREEMQDVDVQVLKGVVYISLSDNMLYKSGSYEISERAGETLSKIAKIIMDYSDYEVLVEGNTDNVPISQRNIRNNWDLSALRGSSVVQALQNDYGVDPKRLTAAGRGEYNPIASNDTESGKTRNRRTQIIITPKLDQFMELIDKAPENGATPDTGSTTVDTTRVLPIQQ